MSTSEDRVPVSDTGSLLLTWTLRTGDTLVFNAAREVGDVRKSSDNIYSATLTEKRKDDDYIFFTSTLLVLEPVNGSNITCTGAGAATLVDITTTIVLSAECPHHKNALFTSYIIYDTKLEQMKLNLLADVS